MKKLKLILPMLAFIFAIGLTFASIELKVDPSKDYIHMGGDSWQPIAEVNCAAGNKTCTVQFAPGGPIYNVYDEQDLSTLKDSDTDIPVKLY